MKNKNFIAVVLVLSMMLMGAGYAAWSQQFEVTATVDTGQMSIEIDTVDSIIVDGEVTNEDDDSLVTPDYVNGTINEEETDLAINVVLNEMYPGAVATFDFTVTNTGTMKVIIDPNHAEYQAALVSLSQRYEGIEFIWNTGNADLALEPEASVTIDCEINMDSSLEGDTSEEEVVTFNIPVRYTQFNVVAE